MTTEYKRADRHVYRRVAGEHLLVATHRDTVAPLYTLTATAAAVWEGLADWATADAVSERLVRDFQVTREQASEDVRYFLEQLRLINALQEREGDE